MKPKSVVPKFHQQREYDQPSVSTLQFHQNLCKPLPHTGPKEVDADPASFSIILSTPNVMQNGIVWRDLARKGCNLLPNRATDMAIISTHWALNANSKAYKFRLNRPPNKRNACSVKAVPVGVWNHWLVETKASDALAKTTFVPLS